MLNGPGISRILLDSLGSILTILEKHGIPHAVMGGLAVQCWGRPRSTRDIDLCVSLADRSEQDFADLLRQTDFQFQDARQLGCTRLLRFLRQDSRTGLDVEIDIFPSLTPHQQQTIERAVSLQVAGLRLRVATPEDLILQKLASGRVIDLYDAEELVKEQEFILDWEYLRYWGRVLNLDEGVTRLSSLLSGSPQRDSQEQQSESKSDISDPA